MAAEDICKDYTSSLEDLTFNSKPLINMLTMLAEENSQHAAEIVNLIEKRIYEVSIEQKLPSLYLMDSIVKNIGKDYINAASPCIVALFTHVFEQADEKVRMSMFKLRNTWTSFFSAKTLHELDCSVHKRDPGWPVVEPAPQSPSIHINPKFLSKVEETVDESKAGSSSSDEAKIMDEFERKKKELELLQGDQMREQMMQLEELKMKYELIKKKQEKDRQKLLKQQQEQILKMRLEQEELDSAEESSSDSKLSKASAKQSSKDPRLKKVEQVTNSKADTDSSTDNTKVEAENITAVNVTEKPVDKVGFDMEFVPLDKEDDNMDTAPALNYNRDRPLGKNRYFRKDPKARIMKSDSDSGSDFGDAKKSRNDKHEDAKSINRRGKRLREHHNDRQQPSKESDRGVRETLEERKKSEHGRGRARRRHSGDIPGDRSNDRPGEPTGEPTGHQPSGRPGDHSVDHQRVRPGEHRRGEHATDRLGVRSGDQRDGRRPGDGPAGRSSDHSGKHPGGRSSDHPENRPGGRPSDHLGEHPGGRLEERARDRGDIGKENKRRRRRSGENEDNEDGRHDRGEEWGRGRGQRRGHRGHAMGRGKAIEGRLGHEFPQPVDNTGRLPERRDQGFDRPDGAPPFERKFGEEPPFKKSRPSPPRPLFSEREIYEIRERRRDSPPPEHSDLPLEGWRNEPHGFHEPWQHDAATQPPPEFFNNQFPTGPRPRPPRFPPHDARPPFAPRGMAGEFLHPPQPFPGDVEIPLELTLDNEAEIIRSADRRLRMGELSLEQHRELLEKLQQLYELQKWQRRRSLDMLPQHEPSHPFIPQPALHPHAAAAGLPLRGMPVMPEPPLNNDHNRVPLPERRMVGEAMPDMFTHQQQLTRPTGMMTGGEGRPQFPVDQTLTAKQEPNILPDQINPTAVEEAGPPSNLVMEKQTVDDLFKRLMNFGIITKVNQGASPARAMTPPVVETQILPKITVPQIPAIPVPQIPALPEIKLTLDHLRRRYDGVIMELHRGTQCSSCGLRFKETDNEHYRQHLDWHFRMNRKDKETLTAHRSWFITTDDWLEFESSEDPKLKARSAVFEAESEGESEKSEDLHEGSCPVLTDDTEAERACDICFEKFETFWDETSEDWHYKNAVRVAEKTYHYLCYQDAKEADESDVEASDENENTQEDNDDDNADDNNDTSEMQNKEGVAIENSITDDKLPIVTEDTAVGSEVEAEVDSVVQGGDDVAVDNTNKEEIKTESS